MNVRNATDLMTSFAERTGLTSNRAPVRYLWTDAFAVCNFVGLARSTGDSVHLDHAARLIEQVHRTLGKHRPDDPRKGWISGLTEDEGSAHPTIGGLRIGKPLPERSRGERHDEQREWDRDGQYFHYLTKWMHALDVMSRATEQPRFNVWARELGETAFDRFTYVTPQGERRMYWKMSIDLSRPLVESMGAHDPLDGWVTYRQVAATRSIEPDLDEEIDEFAEMIAGRHWTTSDPLGLGGLLIDAARLSQLRTVRTHPQVVAILRSAALGLEHWARSGTLERPASRRLAFRELGLAIGLAGMGQMAESGAHETDSDIGQLLGELKRFASVRGRIVEFWRDPEHRDTKTWRDNRNINDVMLATALTPRGCLKLPRF